MFILIPRDHFISPGVSPPPPPPPKKIILPLWNHFEGIDPPNEHCFLRRCIQRRSSWGELCQTVSYIFTGKTFSHSVYTYFFCTRILWFGWPFLIKIFWFYLFIFYFDWQPTPSNLTWMLSYNVCLIWQAILKTQCDFRSGLPHG